MYVWATFSVTTYTNVTRYFQIEYSFMRTHMKETKSSHLRETETHLGHFFLFTFNTCSTRTYLKYVLENISFGKYPIIDVSNTYIYIYEGSDQDIGNRSPVLSFIL